MEVGHRCRPSSRYAIFAVHRSEASKRAPRSSFMTSLRPTRGEFLDRAFVSAMRFRWQYRGYESEEKAIASLRRACPGLTTAQYKNAFEKSTALYNCALDAVKAREEVFAPVRPYTVDDIPRSRELIEQLRRRIPGFKLATYTRAIGRVMYWHYWR